MRRISSTLCAVVLALIALGIVMLASTSSVRATTAFGNPLYFFWRQLIWLFLSLLFGFVLYRFDYHWWKKSSLPMVIVSVLLLVLVLKIGVTVGGSRRWLRFGVLSFQPSELAKLSVVVALTSWMTRVGHRVRDFKEGLLIPGLGLGVVLLLLFLEPDYGTTILVGVVGMIIMFAAGTRLSYLLVTGALGASVLVIAIMQNTLRMNRVLAFLMPDKYPDVAYHLQQSKIAFHLGGLFGTGLGNSMQKQLYLPEAHTDFILAIIGEELGLIATLLVVALFLGLIVCGMIISFRAPDSFGRLLGFGLTVMIGLQAAINIGVVTGSLPTKGLPLPFISYGGSSLLISVACVSILLNIAQHCTEERFDEHASPVKDKAHRF
ncbi:putative lipid II flippase FtsW [Verrucomicrobiota bacterium]